METLAQVCTIPDLARFLGISQAELQQLIDEGALPVVPNYGQPVVHHSDLEAFLAQRFVPKSVVWKT